MAARAEYGRAAVRADRNCCRTPFLIFYGMASPDGIRDATGGGKKKKIKKLADRIVL
jgi:hypothetical protein